MKNKRFILMYISEVSGHHSATIAIENAIKTIDPHAEILNINAFHYTNPISERIVNRLYMGVIKRTPKLWDYLYDNPKIAKKIDKIKKAIHKMNSPKLKNLFDQFKPDCVLCSQAFPCGMVADFKDTYNSDVPLVAVLTDFIPHAYWIYDNVNYYITPTEAISKRLIERGVSQEKIRAFGIPFNHTFTEPVDKLQLFQKYKLLPDLTTILIMGGGQGLGPIKTIVKSLEKVKVSYQGKTKDIQEIIVAGTNKKLYSSLKRKIKKSKKKIILFGYTTAIRELMSISDLIITKPGGITTAEALSKQLPLLIIKPLPGQEVNNTNYLISEHAALKITDPRKTHEIVENLLHNPEKLSQLCNSAKRISKPNASIDTAKFLIGICKSL